MARHSEAGMHLHSEALNVSSNEFGEPGPILRQKKDFLPKIAAQDGVVERSVEKLIGISEQGCRLLWTPPPRAEVGQGPR
jgi:hypothetical protein